MHYHLMGGLAKWFSVGCAHRVRDSARGQNPDIFDVCFFVIMHYRLMGGLAKWFSVGCAHRVRDSARGQNPDIFDVCFFVIDFQSSS